MILFLLFFNLFKPDPNVAYIDRFHNLAISEMQKYNIPASISLAQGILESNAGKSYLTSKTKNHFGVQCGRRKCKISGHCILYNDHGITAKYRKYNTDWESWRDHSLFLQKKRYESLKKYGANYQKWAYGLQGLHYARDRGYAKKLIKIIKRYNLDQFDK